MGENLAVKQAGTLEEKAIIAREIALLKILEGKLSCRIPVLDMWAPEIYLYSYYEIPGVVLNTGLYLDLSEKQKDKLAHDLATFAYELHSTIPVEFVQALGFLASTWPLSPEVLQQYVPKLFEDSLHADGKMRHLFEHFFEVHTQIVAKPHAPVLLHHDLHGKNIIVHSSTGRLHGIIDFEDAAIGDPFAEFRLLYEVDVQLMEKTALAYSQMVKLTFDVQRIHTYYLATQYSRLVEIIMQDASKDRMNEVFVELMIYQERYGRIPS